MSKFDRETSKFTNYSTEDGLPNNIICGLLKDDAGSLWISTINGLSRLDTSTGVFTNYGISNGLLVNIFNYQSQCKAQNGELFFGGINGLVSFFPGEILVTDKIAPTVLIKEFTLFNTHNPILCNEAIEDLKEINLTYSDNSFKISFVAIDYRAPENNVYAYKLDGFDDEWHYTNGTSNFATYTNIPSGEYTFIVRQRILLESGMRMEPL